MRRDLSSTTRHAPRIGLIVNPVAGLGGAAGLKGSDGAERQALARARGAMPTAAVRTARALAALTRAGMRAELFVAPGAMGAALAAAAGVAARRIGRIGAVTTGGDTTRIAAGMAAAGAELILFAGGDGTARDVAAGAGDVPVLGIPCGVKMHSAVFAVSPEAAGEIAARFLSDPQGMAWQDADVMDIDEDLLARGIVAARLQAVARAPASHGAMQRAKAPSLPSDDAALEALAEEIVREMPRGQFHLLGCGATLRKVKRRLGGDGTLLGVDVARDGRLVALDADAAALERCAARTPARIVLGVTGGQGFLLGRGNQQISARLLRHVGRENLVVLCGARKLLALDPPVLRVDTGDPELDRAIAGYIRVRTAPGQSMMMRVCA